MIHFIMRLNSRSAWGFDVAMMGKRHKPSRRSGQRAISWSRQTMRCRYRNRRAVLFGGARQYFANFFRKLLHRKGFRHEPGIGNADFLAALRTEEHTSELQSLMRNEYDVSDL